MNKIITSFCAVLMAVLMLGSVCQVGYAQGTAPLAENLELKTYRNVSVGGMLSAYDPEGSSLKFEISTKPVKGEIELDEKGSFIYTPFEGKKGKDYFGYKAIDEDGNVSQEATVIISIEKQKTDIKYSDLKGRAEEYAAVELAEQNIFIGEKIGGDYCFYPDESMSKAEFLALSMLVSDEPIMSAVMSLGEDQEHIPQWLKTYLCTNRLNGKSIELDWSSDVLYSEAAAMLDNSLGLTEVSYVFNDSTVDDYTAQACANLSACGIANVDFSTIEPMSRGEAAQMLCNAMEFNMER